MAYSGLSKLYGESSFKAIFCLFEKSSIKLFQAPKQSALQTTSNQHCLHYLLFVRSFGIGTSTTFFASLCVYVRALVHACANCTWRDWNPTNSKDLYVSAQSAK